MTKENQKPPRRTVCGLEAGLLESNLREYHQIPTTDSIKLRAGDIMEFCPALQEFRFLREGIDALGMRIYTQHGEPHEHINIFATLGIDNSRKARALACAIAMTHGLAVEDHLAAHWNYFQVAFIFRAP